MIHIRAIEIFKKAVNQINTGEDKYQGEYVRKRDTRLPPPPPPISKEVQKEINIRMALSCIDDLEIFTTDPSEILLGDVKKLTELINTASMGKLNNVNFEFDEYVLKEDLEKVINKFISNGFEVISDGGRYFNFRWKSDKVRR